MSGDFMRGGFVRGGLTIGVVSHQGFHMLITFVVVSRRALTSVTSVCRPSCV